MEKDRELELEGALSLFMSAAQKGCMIVEGTASNIDETEWTCDVAVTDATFYGVPLKILLSEQGSVVAIGHYRKKRITALMRWC